MRRRWLQNARAPLLDVAGLERAIYSAILRGRRAARAAGLARLTEEVEALKLAIETRETPGPQSLAVDDARAHYVARAYTERWSAAAEESTAEDSDEAADEANDATAAALARFAISENAEAFTEERTDAAEELASPELARVWDATLEACPVCARLDGTIVGLDEPFPDGEPGNMHPHCRCSWTLIRRG